MSISVDNIGVGKTNVCPRRLVTRKGLNRFPSEQPRETNRGNAMCLKRKPSAITLISSNASPQRSLISSSLIPTLHTVTTVHARHEVVFTAADSVGGAADRADESRDRLHMLRPEQSDSNTTSGDSSSVGRRSPREPLVYDLPVLDAPSRAASIWALDLHRARVEGLYQGARLAMGSVAKDPTPAGSGRHASTFKARSKARAWLKVFWLILTGRWRFPE